ncbi:MAG: hypothetical protein RLZZ385_1157 [Pseudomonadota bacterium]|jgi:hypothetical protein
MPAHVSASARSQKVWYWVILPLRNTKPSAKRPSIQSVAPCHSFGRIGFDREEYLGLGCSAESIPAGGGDNE